VLYGAIGFYMVTRPVAGLASLTLAIAAYLVAKGLLEGAIAFELRTLPGSGWLVFDGILSVVIAAMIAAAPRGPPITQPVSASARRMCSRSASSRVTAADVFGTIV
jgi:short repeat uncharacterized protein DUF308